MLIPGYFGGIVAAQKKRHLALSESAHLAECPKIVIELWCGHYVKVDVEAGVTADYRLQRHIDTRKTGKFAGCGKCGNKRAVVFREDSASRCVGLLCHDWFSLSRTLYRPNSVVSVPCKQLCPLLNLDSTPSLGAQNNRINPNVRLAQYLNFF